MVVLAVEVEPKLYGLVREAVATGGYESFQQFLEVAVWNQLALEEGASGNALRTRPVGEGQPGSDRRLAEEGQSGGPKAPEADRGWRNAVRRVDVGRLGQLVEPSVSDDSQVLWGQTNRVLPIYAGVRVLTHLLAQTDAPVPRREWYEAATRTARLLRVQLQQWDKEAGRKRGELWATAFPEYDESSAHRYISQFLGMPAKDGRGAGGAAFLGFVDFDGLDDSSPVRLTTSGAEWSGFVNPIFDTESPTRTFSVEETAFFLDHLRRYRQGDYRLLANVASFVAEGRSRTDIDAELRRLYPSWTKYIGTMRAGAIGRLTDLGLLGRTRRGLEVDYHLTELASELGLTTASPEEAQ